MQRLQEGLAAVRAQQPGDTVPALTFLLASPDEQVQVPARMWASPGAARMWASPGADVGESRRG